jgi:L-amino acid N-acyltransferase YncA
VTSTGAIRRADPTDAPGIVAVLRAVVEERVHSAIDRAWSVEQEESYLRSLSSREAIDVAIDDAGTVVGIQILDRWSSLIDSMAHVGQLGTFVLPAWRHRGVGHQLWAVTARFARAAGYRKLAIQVRASNAPAQAFYRRLGFEACGRLRQQVRINDVDDDALLMEMFLQASYRALDEVPMRSARSAAERRRDTAQLPRIVFGSRPAEDDVEVGRQLAEP